MELLLTGVLKNFQKLWCWMPRERVVSAVHLMSQQAFGCAPTSPLCSVTKIWLPSLFSP